MTPPHLHPTAQLFGGKWISAENDKCDINWLLITIPNIVQLCRQQVGKDKSWHPHLSDEDLSCYLEEVTSIEYWWHLLTPLLADPAADCAS